MIQNYSSGNREEVDVLITFKKGSLTYRTAMACRDHGRPAGPSWIRDLAKQREHCRLDKIIAFHSAGFTKPARQCATDEHIDLYTTGQIDTIDFRAALRLPVRLMTVLVAAKLIQNVWIDVPVGAELPDVAGGLTTLLFDGKEMSAGEFRGSCKALIEEWMHRELCSEGTIPSLPEEYSQVSWVDYQVDLPPGSRGQVKGGGNFAISNIHGTAAVIHRLCFACHKGTHRVGEHAVMDSEHNAFALSARFLIATDGENTHIHVEPTPETVGTMTWSPPNQNVVHCPFAAFKVAWRPESFMTCGPWLE